MPVLWPLSVRFGAWRHIGWFSPYLLWLFVATATLGWVGARWLPRLAGLRAWTPTLLWSLYALAAFRWVGFLVRSRYESNMQWDAYQQALLPDSLITPVSQSVHTLWHWFTG